MFGGDNNHHHHNHGPIHSSVVPQDMKTEVNEAVKELFVNTAEWFKGMNNEEPNIFYGLIQSLVSARCHDHDHDDDEDDDDEHENCDNQENRLLMTDILTTPPELVKNLSIKHIQFITAAIEYFSNSINQMGNVGCEYSSAVARSNTLAISLLNILRVYGISARKLQALDKLDDNEAQFSHELFFASKYNEDIMQLGDLMDCVAKSTMLLFTNDAIGDDKFVESFKTASDLLIDIESKKDNTPIITVTALASLATGLNELTTHAIRTKEIIDEIFQICVRHLADDVRFWPKDPSAESDMNMNASYRRPNSFLQLMYSRIITLLEKSPEHLSQYWVEISLNYAEKLLKDNNDHNDIKTFRTASYLALSSGRANISIIKNKFDRILAIVDECLKRNQHPHIYLSIVDAISDFILNRSKVYVHVDKQFDLNYYNATKKYSLMALKLNPPILSAEFLRLLPYIGASETLAHELTLWTKEFTAVLKYFNEIEEKECNEDLLETKARYIFEIIKCIGSMYQNCIKVSRHQEKFYENKEQEIIELLEKNSIENNLEDVIKLFVSSKYSISTRIMALTCITCIKCAKTEPNNTIEDELNECFKLSEEYASGCLITDRLVASITHLILTYEEEDKNRLKVTSTCCEFIVAFLNVVPKDMDINIDLILQWIRKKLELPECLNDFDNLLVGDILGQVIDLVNTIEDLLTCLRNLTHTYREKMLPKLVELSHFMLDFEERTKLEKCWSFFTSIPKLYPKVAEMRLASRKSNLPPEIVEICDSAIERLWGNLNPFADSFAYEHDALQNALPPLVDLISFIGPSKWIQNLENYNLIFRAYLKLDARIFPHSEDYAPEEIWTDDTLVSTLAGIFDLIGKVCLAAGSLFYPYFQTLEPLIEEIANNEHAIAVNPYILGTLGEVVLCFKENEAQRLVDKWLPIILRKLTWDDLSSVRNASFTVGAFLHAIGDSGSQYYDDAFNALVPVINISELSIKERANDEEDTELYYGTRDNAVSSLCKMILRCMSHVKLNEAIPIILNALPIKVDFEEQDFIYSALFKVMNMETQIVLDNLDRLLYVFAYSLQQESIKTMIQRGITLNLKKLKSKHQQQYDDSFNLLSDELKETINKNVV